MNLFYWARFRRWPDLAAPRTFNEKVQRRKLWDRDPRLPLLTDKLRVKDFVRETLGEGWVTPTLWSGDALPAAPPWPLPFVVKATHGSGWNRFYRSTSDDWAGTRAAGHGWLRQRYGTAKREWAYRDLTPGLLVEPFIGEAGALPIDYKFWVFGGRVAFIEVDTDRENDLKAFFYSPDWTLLPFELSGPLQQRLLPRPAALDAMLAAAERLARGFDFVRVDLFDLPDGPRFGELTFYPSSGGHAFYPDAYDERVGQLWPEAPSYSPVWSCGDSTAFDCAEPFSRR